MIRRLCLIACALCFVMLWAQMAAAQTNPRDALIRSEGEKAAAAFSARDYAEALRGYRAIEPLLEDMPERAAELAIIRFNIGRCLDKLSRPRAAVQAYLSSEGPSLPPKVAQRVRDRVQALRRDRLGVVRTVCPQGPAQVTVQGIEQTNLPCGATISDLTPGTYRLVATAPDGGIAQAQATVQAGQVSEAEILFAPIAVAPTPEPESDRTVAWSLTGGAALSLAAGVVVYGMALSSNDDYEQKYDRYLSDPMNRSPELESEITSAFDTTNSRLNTSRILLGTGGALGLASLWFWLVD
ncbi:MAG: hypothetical protein ACE366_23805 [Bradymonadia bacterium]